MRLWKYYTVAHSVSEALQCLENTPGSSKIIAGGTDLLLDIQQGRQHSVHTLVDVNEIPEMTDLRISDGELFIGAAVTHNRISTSSLVNEHCKALAIASSLVGGPQVRNVATIGGNVAHALPAADGTIALIALDAQAEVASKRGRRRVPLQELFKGPGKSTIDSSTEILTGFYSKLGTQNQSSSFRRIMRPQGVAIAILNIAVWVQREGDTISDIRISVGPSGPIPRRMTLAEDVLRGKTPSNKVLDLAHLALLKESAFRTSRYRSTESYRKRMSKVLLEETVKVAFQKALDGV